MDISNRLPHAIVLTDVAKEWSYHGNSTKAPLPHAQACQAAPFLTVLSRPALNPNRLSQDTNLVCSAPLDT